MPYQDPDPQEVLARARARLASGGGAEPDPQAVLARARAKLATAKEMFGGPFGAPPADSGYLGPVPTPALPGRDVTGVEAAAPLPTVTPPPTVDTGYPARPVDHDRPSGLSKTAQGKAIEAVSNVLRAEPGGFVGGVTSMTGTGGTAPANWLLEKARSIEGQPGIATTVGQVGGGLAAGAALYGPLAGATAFAPEGSMLSKIAAGLEAQRFLPRYAAQAAVGVPLDIAAAASETRTTGDSFLKNVGRNLAYNLGGTALFEGARQPFMPPMPKGAHASAEQAADIVKAAERIDVADAPLAQAMPGVVPERVQRPASQLQTPGKPIYENPEPIAEARAANPLTDTDPARGLARDIEASPTTALPPEVYAGPDRRMQVPSISADDILNRHRRATDLPPTTAPLVPRVQTGRPRTSTADPALQGVTRVEQAFPAFTITPELRAAIGKGQTLGEPRPNKGQYGLGFGDAPPPPPRPQLAPDAVQAIRESEKTFATRTVAVSRRSQQLGASVVNTPQDLATAAGHLGNGATERLDGILTDANGVPVAVIGGFKGGANWAAAPMQSIISEAFQTPGGKNLWLVHNHPSGITTLSKEDKTVSFALANALRGSGIEYRGAMAIGGGVEGSVRGWEHITPGQDVLNGVVGVAKKGPTVPIMDREFTHHGGLAKQINSPDDARQAIARLAGGQDGILLLNTQRVPVGFVPITPAVAGKLRVEGRSDAVYRAIGVSNATGAIIHAPSMSVAEANNLAGMLKGVEVETLDLIGPGKSTMSLRPNNQWGFGRQPVVSGLAGSGIGATAGALTGNTPEERKRNAILGAALGLGAGVGVGALAERMGQRGAKLSASSPAATQVLATIATDTRPSTRPWLSLGERVKTHLQDETYPLAKLGQELGTGGDLRDLVSQSKGWRGMAAQHSADHLTPVLDAAKGIEGDVAAYAKAQRAVQLMEQGRPMEGGLGRDVYEQTIADLGQNPKVVAAAQQLQDYYRDLLALRHREGVLTDEAYDAIVQSEDFYTPFIHDIGDRPPTAGGGKWFNRGTGVKKMNRAQGTTGQTRDPFTMAVLHTAETYHTVAKQRVTNMVAQLVEADPQAASALIRQVPANTPGSQGNRVVANVGGKQRTYEVLDPDLYAAWAAMDPPQRSIVISLLRPFKTLQTVGVTALPDFMVANVIRDNAMSTIQKPLPWKSQVAGAAIGAGVGAATSEDRAKGALLGAGLGLGLGAVVPNLARSLGAMRSVLKNDDIYQQFLRDGGDSFGYYPRNTADAAKVLRSLQKRGISVTDIINPKQWWHGLEALGRATEQGPRLRAYQEALAGGAKPATAVRAARDISVDFSTVGSRTKGLAATTAFWNAGVQGWEKTLRLMRNPKTWAMGAATITAPSIALWNINKDRQDYLDAPQYERNLFWLVPKAGGGSYRIPKPFEIGFVFGSIPERLLDYLHTKAKGGDTEAAATLRRTLLDMTSNMGGSIIPAPTGIEQGVSQAAGKGGYDFFRDRPIVSRPDVPGEEQYNEYTSSIGYGLGQATGISPQRIDFAIQNLLGGSGRVLLQGTDRLARTMGWDERPLPPGTRNPLLSRFTTNQSRMPESERVIRLEADRADEVERGLRKVMATGTTGAQQRYIERHREDLTITRRGNPYLKRELKQVQDKVKELNYKRDQAKHGGR